MSSDTLAKHLNFCRRSAVLALATTLSLFAVARSGGQNPPPPPVDSQQDQQAPPDQQAPDDRDERKVISRDDVPQDPAVQDQAPNPSAQHPNAPPPPRHPNRNRPPHAQDQAYATAPDTITVPAAKVIFVRLNEPLSSDRNRVGDTFTATLDQPIVVNGWVVAQRGETVVGSVTAAQKAGRVKGVSQLGLDLVEITLADGQQTAVTTELWNGSAGTSHGADAAGVATTTGAGALIGAAANGGEGAGIGAGIGATAGIAGVLLTRGKPTVLVPEEGLSFRLKLPLTVSTVNSKQAFLPVDRRDYDSSPSLRRRAAPYPASYPPPYYTSCGPYWGCGPYYYPYYGPAVGIGFYGGYWGGPHRGFRR